MAKCKALTGSAVKGLITRCGRCDRSFYRAKDASGHTSTLRILLTSQQPLVTRTRPIYESTKEHDYLEWRHLYALRRQHVADILSSYSSWVFAQKTRISLRLENTCIPPCRSSGMHSERVCHTHIHCVETKSPRTSLFLSHRKLHMSFASNLLIQWTNRFHCQRYNQQMLNYCQRRI